MIQYRVVRSSRKSMALQVYPDGTVIVRAPMRVSGEKIRQFVLRNEAWVRKKLEAIHDTPALPLLSEQEMDELKRRAKTVIPARAAYYAPLVGVDYGRITIRCQKTRWGSCSTAGNLNFNCLLMLAPPEVLDSVVVHELCHRLYMNHSPAFYDQVLRVFPQYRSCSAWLKKNGSMLLARVPREN